jgi:hypothetical protein
VLVVVVMVRGLPLYRSGREVVVEELVRYLETGCGELRELFSGHVEQNHIVSVAGWRETEPRAWVGCGG